MAHLGAAVPRLGNTALINIPLFALVLDSKAINAAYLLALENKRILSYSVLSLYAIS